MFSLIADIIREKGLMLKEFPVYFFSPLYAYFNYLLKLVTPNSVMLVRTLIVLQCVLFFVSIRYFKKIVEILVDERAGRLGMFLYGLYPPFIFYSVIPIKDIVTVSLMVIAMFYLLRFVESKKTVLCILIGLLTGCMIHLRGTVALLVPVVIVCICIVSSWRVAVLFLACVSVCILPFTLRNYLVCKEFVLLTPISGIHSYIGNNKDATGVYIHVNNVRSSSFGHFFDARKIAHRQTGEKLNARQTNAYWKKQAWNYITGHPWSALRLYLKKLLLLIHYKEIPSNYFFEQFKLDYPLFGLFNVPYNMGVLTILAALGFMGTRIRFKPWLLVFMAVFATGTIIGFVVGRYRLPLAIFLLIGVTGFIQSIRTKTFQPDIKKIAVAVALCFATWFPSIGDEQAFFSKARDQAKQSQRLIEKFRDQGYNDYELWRRRKNIMYVRSYTRQQFLK
jgi:hypothetical protein